MKTPKLIFRLMAAVGAVMLLAAGFMALPPVGFIGDAQAAVVDGLDPIFRTLSVKASKSSATNVFQVFAVDGSNIFGVRKTNAVPFVTEGGSNFTALSTNYQVWKTNTTLQIIKGVIVGIQ